MINIDQDLKKFNLRIVIQTDIQSPDLESAKKKFWQNLEIYGMYNDIECDDE